MLKLNLVVAAVVIALTGAFTLGLLIPGSRELEDRRVELEGELSNVKADQQKIGDVGSLYASILEMDEAMKDYRERLPADRRFGQFLNELSQNLKKEDIHNYVVQPRPASPVKEAELPGTLALAKGTIILPVSLSFESSFTRVFRLLDNLESLKRLSHVESMRLINSEQDPGHVRVEMVLHTYHRPD